MLKVCAFIITSCLAITFVGPMLNAASTLLNLLGIFLMVSPVIVGYSAFVHPRIQDAAFRRALKEDAEVRKYLDSQK